MLLCNNILKMRYRLVRPIIAACISQFAASVDNVKHWPGITEEVCTLPISSPHQPLSEGRVAKHACFIPTLNEEAREQLHALLEVIPLQLSVGEARVEGLEHLLVGQGVQRGKCHIEDGQRALEGWISHKLHIALQLVELCQRDGHHFVARALDHQVASFKQIQGEFQVQVGALAAWDQVATELPDGDRVSFAIQADITHDFLAAVYPILNIGIEVVANLLVVREVIQGDLFKGQEAGDLL